MPKPIKRVKKAPPVYHIWIEGLDGKKRTYAGSIRKTVHRPTFKRACIDFFAGMERFYAGGAANFPIYQGCPVVDHA